VSSLLAISAGAFGASAGAFLPRLVHRWAVPAGQPPRSSCAVCARPFRYAVHVGRACPCAADPGPPPAVIAGSAAGLLAATLGARPLLPVLLLATLPGTLLALVDRRCLRLPDPLVVALAAVLVLAVPVAGSGAVPRAALAATLVGLAYLAVALLPGAGLGLGDVKLAAVLAVPLGCIGWPAVLLGMTLPHLINAPAATAALIRGRGRRAELPFGPALLAGALAAIALTA